MKFFTTLKFKDIISFVVLIAAGFGWTMIDQLFLPKTYQRMIALVLILAVLFFLQFSINKPKQTWKYATTIAVISVAFVIVTSVIMHVLVHHDFSVKGLIIIAITAIIPYGSCGIYIMIRKRR
jgi:FtsH-binding integral membrane protein